MTGGYGPQPGTPGYRPPSNGEDRLLARRRIEDGHWLYDGPLNGRGYALLHIGSRVDGTRTKIGAHRLAWLLWRGPIPPGWHVHHRCKVRHCFNPEHLEVKEPSEHQRSDKLRPDTCKRGHPRTPENTYVKKDGTRQCRACRRERRY